MQIAQQLIDLYRWCKYNDIEIMGGYFKALGYKCPVEIVATEDIKQIEMNMVRVE